LPFHRRAELTAADAEAAEIHATGHSGFRGARSEALLLSSGNERVVAEEWTLAADEEQQRR
jgi:hypothetical protein